MWDDPTVSVLVVSICVWHRDVYIQYIQA
jgi:hypothetical protein